MNDIVKQTESLTDMVLLDQPSTNYIALVKRRDLPDSWDLVIDAPWALADELTALNYLVNLIRSNFGNEYLLKLARIVIMDRDLPWLQRYDAWLRRRNKRQHRSDDTVHVMQAAA